MIIIFVNLQGFLSKKKEEEEKKQKYNAIHNTNKLIYKHNSYPFVIIIILV